MLSKNNEPGAFVEKILRFCGMGSIKNYPTFPSTLKCTELLIAANAECGIDIKNILCSFWKYRDNNVCNGLGHFVIRSCFFELETKFF